MSLKNLRLLDAFSRQDNVVASRPVTCGRYYASPASKTSCIAGDIGFGLRARRFTRLIADCDCDGRWPIVSLNPAYPRHTRLGRLLSSAHDERF